MRTLSAFTRGMAIPASIVWGLVEFVALQRARWLGKSRISREGAASPMKAVQ